MQQVVERHELLGRMDPLLGLPAQGVHPADDVLVELGIEAHRVIDPAALLHEPRQDVVDVAHREGVVGAEVPGGAVRSCALAVPGLPRGIAVPYEQDVLGLRASGYQHGHRLRLVEPGEVMKIAVGPVVVMDVTVALLLGGGRQDGDAPLAHHAQQLAATPRELVFANGHGPVSDSYSGEAARDAGSRARRG